MGSDDYAPVGGSLRLKGGIIKKKPKKKKKAVLLSDTPEGNPVAEASRSPHDAGQKASSSKQQTDEDEHEMNVEISIAKRGDLRTDAERKFEETRRKRLDQKLLKDAGKSHKERVEDFNKYLSNLSEHHDMPRIGPG